MRSYLLDKHPKPTLELIGANVTEDPKKLQDPLKTTLHDAILTAIIKFEDENPR